MKYKIKFRAVAYCTKEIDIKDESRPYEEAQAIGLDENDFTIDVADSYIHDLTPIPNKETCPRHKGIVANYSEECTCFKENEK